MRNGRLFFFSFLILFGLLAIFYLLCLMLDFIDVFWALLSRMGCSVATRAMYISFIRMTSCSGSMALFLFFSLSKEGICYMEDAGPSTGGRAVDSGSGSDNWQKYLNLSEENASAASAPTPTSSDWSALRQFQNIEADPQINARGANHSPSHPASEGTHRPHLSSTASPPSSSFFRGLWDMSPAPDLGGEVQQVILAHSISQTDLWNSLSSSAPTPGQDNQPPLVVEQAGPSQMAPPEPLKEEIVRRLEPFLASFGNRDHGKIFNRALEEIKEKLDLDRASPPKLQNILQLMQELHGKPWSRADAKNHFLKEITKWEKGGGGGI